MEISKVEVFECHKCGKISKKQGDILSCLKKHGKEELQQEESAPYLELHDNVMNFMIKNLHSLNPVDVGEQLTAVSKLIGINLNISRIVVGKNEIDTRYSQKEYMTYNISGSCSRIHETEFKKISLPKHLKGNLNHHFERLIDPKEYLSFSTICDLLAGVTTHGGSGGGNTFNYDIRLWIDAFPELNKKWQALKELRLKRTSYIQEKHRLTEDYDKHRKPAVLISDIRYQEIKSEWDEIHLQMEELKLRSLVVGKEMEQRSEYILSKDAPKHITPAPEFDFDRELRKKLISELGIQ